MSEKEFFPFSYKRFKKDFPGLEREYDRLAKKCHASGPLNEKTRRLINWGLHHRIEGAIKSHARRVWPRYHPEIRHTVLC
jgi:hypothetical protein